MATASLLQIASLADVRTSTLRGFNAGGMASVIARPGDAFCGFPNTQGGT